MSSSIHKSHLDQYPLALLLEDGYLGTTFNHIPPEGAETIREFSLAVTLHMFTLPRDAHGIIRYLGIESSGNLAPEKQRVFLKSKGSLHLDEQAQRFWDRLWSFIAGFSAGIAGFSAGCLVAIATAWARKKLGLP
jgi:hypothetical protein